MQEDSIVKRRQALQYLTGSKSIEDRIVLANSSVYKDRCTMNEKLTGSAWPINSHLEAVL
jgi:hypothetical protein